MQDSPPQKMVLIIDDDCEFCNQLKMILDEHGFAAVILTSADLGIDHLKIRKPDLITLNLMMRGEINGINLFRFLRTTEEWKRIPIMVVSNMTRGEADLVGELKKIFKDGSLPMPDAFCEKPLEPARFINEVKKILPSPT